jgi:nucleoside-diphosphate-sugar epimerase
LVFKNLKLEHATNMEIGHEKFLLLGGRGALGAAFAKLLARSGIEHTVVSRTRAPESRIDIRLRESIRGYLEGRDYTNIVNFSGLTHGSPTELFETNVLGPQNILEAVSELLPDARVTLIGSAAEYGETEAVPIKEEHALVPQSLYGLSKQLQTIMVPYYVKRGIHVNIARVFNVSDGNLPEHSLIGKLHSEIKKVSSGHADKIELGSLDGVRDYLDSASISDLILLVNRKGRPGEAYNVGSGKPTLCRDLVRSIVLESGLSEDLIQEASNTRSQKSQISVSYASLEKTLSLKSL